MEAVKLTPFLIEVAPRQGYKVMGSDIHPSLLASKIPVPQPHFIDVFGEAAKVDTIIVNFRGKHISQVEQAPLYFVRTALEQAQKGRTLLYIYYIEFLEDGDNIKATVRGA